MHADLSYSMIFVSKFKSDQKKYKSLQNYANTNRPYIDWSFARYVAPVILLFVILFSTESFVSESHGIYWKQRI